MTEEFNIPPDAKENPLTKLDVVLMFLYVQTYMQTLDEIHKGVYEYVESDDNEVSLILGKLEKDSFIVKQELPIHDVRSAKMVNVYHFAITFDGKIFLKQGGYSLEAIRLSEQNKRVEKLESDQMAIQTNIQTLTFWIAAGAIIAAAYYLYCLIIPIYDHFFSKK